MARQEADEENSIALNMPVRAATHNLPSKRSRSTDVASNLQHPLPTYQFAFPATPLRHLPTYPAVELNRTQQLTTILTLSLGLLLLIGPLWLLNMLSTEKARLTTISILVASFVGLIGVGTGAKPSETLAAAAA